jgi:pyruvate/2-oxoglutarate dehydrogenase complex dihydrolipoamide dehydrogenase (E3) component
MSAVLRKATLSEARGFTKALIAADNDRILGFTAFGPDAGEIMPVVQVAIPAGLPHMALRDLILARPTIAAALIGLFSAEPRSASS